MCPSLAGVASVAGVGVVGIACAVGRHGRTARVSGGPGVKVLAVLVHGAGGECGPVLPSGVLLLKTVEVEFCRKSGGSVVGHGHIEERMCVGAISGIGEKIVQSLAYNRGAAKGND